MPVIVVRWQGVVDFLVLTTAIYVVLRWAQQARALRVALLVIGLHASALVARHFDMPVTSWVLDGAAILAIVLLVLVFQPELRRFFMKLDSVLSWRSRTVSKLEETYDAVAQAAFHLAADGVGALMVVVRNDSVAELVSGGILLEAAVTAEILEAIFQKTSPVHDGAVIVRGDRIVRASGVLPLTDRERVPSYYGTRHRAGMGLSERSDALVVVVSEERGEVTLMEARRMTRLDDPARLAEVLQKLSASPPPDRRRQIRSWIVSNARVKFAALGLAAAIWGTSFLSEGRTVRTVAVPVEFVSVPSGMDLGAGTTDHLEVQVRGSSWMVDSMSLNRLVARFDLRGARPGSTSIPVDSANLNLPPGILMEQVTPPRIAVRLVTHKK